MCLAVPAKVVEIDAEIAVVEINGVMRKGNVSLIGDVEIGDYVLLHAGFAIKKWSEEDVREYRRIVDEMQLQDKARQ